MTEPHDTPSLRHIPGANSKAAARPGGPDRPQDDEPWAFIVLMIAEVLFVLGLVRAAHLSPFRSFTEACVATSLAAALVYTKPAILAIGRRLKVVEAKAVRTRRSRLLLAVLAELVSVFMIRMGIPDDPDVSLLLATAITALCLLTLEAHPALLAIGKRFLSQAP